MNTVREKKRMRARAIAYYIAIKFKTDVSDAAVRLPM